MSKSMILLITIFALWVFLILFKKGGTSVTPDGFSGAGGKF